MSPTEGVGIDVARCDVIRRFGQFDGFVAAGGRERDIGDA
jgi:hypothetical protein